MKTFKQLFSDEKRILRSAWKIVREIESLSLEYHSLSDSDLINKTQILKSRLKKGTPLVNLLVEAYATVREASKRIIGEYHFPVQLLGGVILHFGDVAEMKTGEGKTLTSLLPVYLNALTEEGVHVVTVNEYLAERDATNYGKVLRFLGISVGINKSNLNLRMKKQAYACDVTYTTNSELGFDYLRDNMVLDYNQKVIRKLNFCLIDECDSILIDEARTPLIISGGKVVESDFYESTDAFAKSVVSEDYKIDLESKSISLTLQGQKKAEEFFKVKSLYEHENSKLVHFLQNALRANKLFEQGIEYIVRNNKIELVDQFTGRVLEGRTYSEGLHQAIETKEKVEVTPETTVVATITYQNFFRLYKKIAGMTGTAKTEEDEFQEIYNMRVICIPTNKKIIRKDLKDLVFLNKKYKHAKLIEKIEQLNKKRQPVLVGTPNVETSEIISKLLSEKHIPHQVLNAKHHEKEAQIISRAGQLDQITIATNMAGRGTDIKLSPEARALGGLVVLSLERFESRRIDNQFRGRSGRQGDPGITRFYLSLEDEILIRFAGDKLKKLYKNAGELPIQSKNLKKLILNAQTKIEGINFDSRKNVLEYDSVLSQQRELMYDQRDAILLASDLKEICEAIIKKFVSSIIKNSLKQVAGEMLVDNDLLKQNLNKEFFLEEIIDTDNWKYENSDKMKNFLDEKFLNYYRNKRKKHSIEINNYLEKQILIKIFDEYWTNHINDMARLKHGIYLRSYAQKNPLEQYILESSNLFNNLREKIASETVKELLNTEIGQSEEPLNQNPYDKHHDVLRSLSKIGG